jgi:hypothetical protein
MLHTGEKEGNPIFCVYHFWGVLRSSLPAWFAGWHSCELPASTTGELPTSAVLLPSSPTKRRKLRQVLLPGTPGELPTSTVLLPYPPTERRKIR